MKYVVNISKLIKKSIKSKGQKGGYLVNTNTNTNTNTNQLQ